MEYRLIYQVQAPNKLMAWMGAGQLLRSGVVVKEVVDTKRIGVPPGDWWEVTLSVEEDIPEPRWLHEDPEYADPITAAKAEAVRVEELQR